MIEADRWARVGALFDAVVDKPPAEREAAVRASHEAADIQDEVLSLLGSHDEAATFLAPPPPPAAPAIPGTLLGPYRIISTLGHGGMGIVYQAEDTRLHRVVALKLLSPTPAPDERQRERLKQEARAAAALSHPGIATVYALEEIDDQLVIATEYLDGETLRAEMARGALPPAHALDAAAEIACAMAAAHDRGIVHRDLKPENILRTRDGALKVLDFGLAQFDGTARELISMTLTEAGLVAGTPPYMAPEQLLGRTMDSRTDQFAFGVILYEMAAGRHPFGGQSLPSTIAKILAAPPEPPPPDDRLPPELWAIVDRCLQKDPSGRFASTHELVQAIESARGTLHPSTRTAPEHLSHPPSLAPGTQRASARLAEAVDGREGGGTALDAPGAPASGAPAYWWWQFHQLAAACVYWGMIWPAWHVHRDIGRGGLFFFFATLAAVVVSGNLRIHLWFSSRVYPEHLEAQRADTGRWIRFADCAFVALLVAGGLLLPDTSAGWAALFISVGMGSAVAFLIIEPATARAAFARAPGPV
jgi:serine/threonine protein kinase